MRNRILFLLLFFLAFFSKAQKQELNLDDIHPVFKHDSHGDSIRKYFTSTFYSKGKTGLMISVFFSNKLEVNNKDILQKIPQLKKYKNHRDGIYEVALNGTSGSNAIPIFDTSGIIVTVNGINQKNAHLYEFRVVENNERVIVPWRKPKLFVPVYWMSRIADPNKVDEVTAYLGHFNEKYNKALTIEVRKKALPDSIIVSVAAYWVKWKPKVVGVFTFDELPKFLSIFHQQWGSQMLRNSYNKNWKSDTSLLKLKNVFNHDDNNLIFYLDDIISSKKVTEYNLVNGSDSTGWKSNDFDFNLIWLKSLNPGQYKLKLRYSMQPEHVAIYHFTIHAAWYQTLWAKIGLSLLVILAIGFVVLLWRSRKQTERLKTQRNLKQLVQTELKSIRSQFNPHFVFNALSSIQGLITKNDSENASKYLLEFSNLMRDSLKASTREFVSIASEIKILENYLKLEKLRFGFNYQIETSSLIDSNAVEIPSLFLQPLLENAVKHGISSLQEKGWLFLTFEKDANDMVVRVKDNGKGFIDTENFSGFGLVLTKERIKLLNQTLNEQHIEFSVQRVNDETQVIIYFKNWLL
ncbi:histidine kinase [Pedobacter sp. Du54]|uniref:sensor histidine kinase n=1 Tax=Pedobacter anseongensis TaxID=3133439 RepID=UPI0030A59C76